MILKDHLNIEYNTKNGKIIKQLKEKPQFYKQ